MTIVHRTRILHRLIPLAAAVLALGMITSTQAAAAPTSKTFSWNSDLRAGDCTMFHGATWTVYFDGTAKFDAVVTSGSNGDAWLMWAELRDRNNAVLAHLTNPDSSLRDQAEYVQNVGDKTKQYHWIIRKEDKQATFDQSLFPLIEHMHLDNHC